MEGAETRYSNHACENRTPHWTEQSAPKIKSNSVTDANDCLQQNVVPFIHGTEGPAFPTAHLVQNNKVGQIRKQVQ
jgi:hypothetical protein